MTRHEMALAAVPSGCGCCLLARDRRDRVRQSLAFVPGVVAGVVAWLAFNVIRFGNPFDSGYLRDTIPGFGSPIVRRTRRPAVQSRRLAVPLFTGGTPRRRRAWCSSGGSDRSAAMLLLVGRVVFLVLLCHAGQLDRRPVVGSRYLVVVIPYLAVGWAVLARARSAREWRAVCHGCGNISASSFSLPGVDRGLRQGEPVSHVRPPFTTTERQWAGRPSPLVLNARAHDDRRAR